VEDEKGERDAQHQLDDAGYNKDKHPAGSPLQGQGPGNCQHGRAEDDRDRGEEESEASHGHKHAGRT
jgi:hypothetical protein